MKFKRGRLWGKMVSPFINKQTAMSLIFIALALLIFIIVIMIGNL